METLISILNGFKVALGLGFVIFIHELGHFLLAKWNGVKVEKFSIGFGPTLLGFRRGETEYVLAAVPLGGFVKMLGEGSEDETAKSTDPRAYSNKSVGARMSIISAGVIMNVLLGLACFVYAYGQGMDENPAIIGSVKAGSPAYKAGIRPGDEVISLDGRSDINFKSMNMAILHSASGQKLHFELKRPGEKEPIRIDVEPTREGSSPYPRIGVANMSSLRFAAPPFLGSPPPGMQLSEKEAEKLDIKPNDVLVAVGPEGAEPKPVSDAREMQEVFAAYRSKPLTLVLERTIAEEKGKPQTVKVTLPPNRIVDFGLRMAIEPISSIRAGSIAEKAGFQVGDRIISVGDKPDMDPLRYGDYCYEHAGQPVTFEVERQGKDGKPERVSLTAIPDNTPIWLDFMDEVPQEIPGLGLAYPVSNKVVAVRDDSPAAKAGIIVGDEVTKLTFPPLTDDKKAQSISLEFGPKSQEWPTAFSYLQLDGKKDLELTVKRLSKAIKIRPEPNLNDDWYTPWRGLRFRELIRRLPPQSISASLRRGADDTLDNILKIYALLRSLVQSRVSPTLLGGPIMIAQVAYSQAETGLTELIHFLGLLSINLAVLNFLPIPPLDGGQMVFLIGEKVRGKPLPESAVQAGSMVGIFLLICLMLFVMFQDVLRSFFN